MFSVIQPDWITKTQNSNFPALNDYFGTMLFDWVGTGKPAMPVVVWYVTRTLVWNGYVVTLP